MTASDKKASVRYIVDDVQAAIDFYTTHLGFTGLARLRRLLHEREVDDPGKGCHGEAATHLAVSNRP